MNSRMDQIEFPPEIAIFADRIDDQWLGKIQMAFVENQKTKSHLKLSDWLEILQELYLQEKLLPKEVWALSAKLAWIQAEVSFFISNSDLIDNIKNDPLCLCYFGAGFAELIDFEKGFKLLQQAVSLAKSNSDWYALIDMMIPYSIVMSNTENKQELKEFHGFINQVIAKELNSDPYYQSLVSSCCFFSREKIDASEDDKIKEQLQASLSHGHHLNSALLYNQLSKKNDESSYKRNMENGIKELNKIDARFRILIAYTNLGIFYASKAKYEISEGFFDQAFAIIKNISLSKKYGSGLFVYPLTEKARIYVERGMLQEAQETYQKALERSNRNNNSLYKVRTNFGLAYSFFLLQQYDLAYKYAKEANTLSKGLHDPQLKDSCNLKYVDILTDLNRLKESSSILAKLNTENFSDCLRVHHEYVKGKFELYRHNIGTAKEFLFRALDMVEKCSILRSSILFTLSEGFINEYRLSNDSKILQEAQEMIEKGLEGIIDVPTRTKGNFLSAILLSAQERYEEAEEILEVITSGSIEVPHFRDLADKLLDNIRDSRITNANISPITNFRDVVRYLRDVKSSMNSNLR